MNRIYKIFFLLLAIAIIVYVLLNLNLFNKQSENVALIQVRATLLCNDDNIQVMRGDKEVWEPIANEDIVEWGDRISVPQGSSASLVINAQSKIEIEENSEVLLEQTKDGQGAVFVTMGEVRYYLDADVSRKLGKLKYSGGEAIIVADNVRSPVAESGLSQRGSQASVSNYRGDINLKIQSGDYEIETGKAAIIPADGSKPSIVNLPDKPQIRTPNNGEEVAQGYMRIGFDMMWTPVAGANKYRVQFLPKRIKIESFFVTTNPGLRIRNLNPNPYEARVYAEDLRGLKSPWSDPIDIEILSKYFNTLEPGEGKKGVYVGFVPYREKMLAGGFVKGYNPDEHDVILFARTDFWWIQPLLEDYNTQLERDGYFETYTNLGDALAVIVVKKGFTGVNTKYPPDALPSPNGSTILEVKTVGRNIAQ